MSDDDDDEPAITEGMEPELKPGDRETGHDDDVSVDDAEDVNLGGMSEGGMEIVGKRGHPRSAQTRALLKKAAADLKAQRDAGDDEDDDYEYEEDEKPAPGDKRTGAPVVEQVE